MSTMSYRYVKENIEFAKKIIRFFSAEINNLNEFENIKSVCSSFTSDETDIQFIQMGYFSVSDCKFFLFHENPSPNSYSESFITHVLKSLESEHAVNKLPQKIAGYTRVPRYRLDTNFGKFLNDRGLLLNIVAGWQYIIDFYSDSVFKIQHEHSNGDISIGTGFYFAAGNSETEKFLIITNKHVLENVKSIKIYSRGDHLIDYCAIITDPKRDLGYILLANNLTTPFFHFNSSRDILEEILTIGYPSIPMTKLAYQTYHKGELNSFVEDYKGNQFFLFSAKTSSGNSGSPIIDRFGMVIGIVTEELFDEYMFSKMGKLPYYAGIPTDEIIKSLNETVFI